MNDQPRLLPLRSSSVRPVTSAEPEDLRQAFAFMPRYRGRKWTDSVVEAMAEITADRLVEHLAQ